MGDLSKPLHLKGVLSQTKGINGRLGNPRSISGTLQKGTIGATYVYYDTTENWNKKSQVISERGAIYVYSDYFLNAKEGHIDSVPAIKVGDGVSYISDLSFITDAIIVADYAALENKPSINEVPLAGGNNNLEDFGIGKASTSDVSKLFS